MFFSLLKKIFFIAVVVSAIVIGYDFWKGNSGKTISNEVDETIRGFVEIPPIEVYMPLDWEVVRSPLKISGKAHGSWYFEGQFSIRLVDPNGKILGKSIVDAKDDWMNDAMVPFESEIEFKPPLPSKGFLVFLRDDSSGIKAPVEYRVPVLFE